MHTFYGTCVIDFGLEFCIVYAIDKTYQYVRQRLALNLPRFLVYSDVVDILQYVYRPMQSRNFYFRGMFVP